MVYNDYKSDYEMGLESKRVLSIYSAALNSYISKLEVL